MKDRVVDAIVDRRHLELSNPESCRACGNSAGLEWKRTWRVDDSFTLKWIDQDSQIHHETTRNMRLVENVTLAEAQPVYAEAARMKERWVGAKVPIVITPEGVCIRLADATDLIKKFTKSIT